MILGAAYLARSCYVISQITTIGADNQDHQIDTLDIITHLAKVFIKGFYDEKGRGKSHGFQ